MLVKIKEIFFTFSTFFSKESFVSSKFTVKVEKGEGLIQKSYDGVFEATGLREVISGEVLYIINRFSKVIPAVVFTLLKKKVVGMFFGDVFDVCVGDTIVRSQRLGTIAGGYSILGQIVNPFGQSLLINSKKIENATESLIDIKGPGIVSRFKVNDSLVTGIKVIDSLFPIGRGQRELVIGDRQTGKTSILVDSILNQKFDLASSNRPVFSVYVGIGQKCSSIYRLFNFFYSNNVLSFSTIVSATASDSVASQYLAPFSGVAICEFFARLGYDTLIGYDDLSKHAVAYRQLSLLLRRAPGREAYPGDVFFLHSRLLERAANLLLCGSITALPVVETLSGDVSAYIPTNVISITDGQIFLDANLFYQGVIPAINVGLSVSRVGAAAQPSLLKKVAGSLKLQLALFREIEGFASFSSNLDEQTITLLKKGQILIETLKQKRFECLKPVAQAYTICVASLTTILFRYPLQILSSFTAFCFFIFSANIGFFSVRPSFSLPICSSMENNFLIFSTSVLAKGTSMFFFNVL